jgi:hypothetical protein
VNLEWRIHLPFQKTIPRGSQLNRPISRRKKLVRLCAGTSPLAVKSECENHLIFQMSADNCLAVLLLQDENHPAHGLMRKEAAEFFRLHQCDGDQQMKRGETGESRFAV